MVGESDFISRFSIYELGVVPPPSRNDPTLWSKFTFDFVCYSILISFYVVAFVLPEESKSISAELLFSNSRLVDQRTYWYPAIQPSEQ